MFNEAEAEAPGTDEAPDTRNDTPARSIARKAHGKRWALPPALPRVDVSEDQRQCDCGTAKVKIGEELSEQLDIIPMQIRVIHTVRPRYACPKGAAAPAVAPAPPRALPQADAEGG